MHSNTEMGSSVILPLCSFSLQTQKNPRSIPNEKTVHCTVRFLSGQYLAQCTKYKPRTIGEPQARIVNDHSGRGKELAVRETGRTRETLACFSAEQRPDKTGPGDAKGKVALQG